MCSSDLVEVDRAKAETLQVSIDDVFATLGAYLGSSYVDQFNKFGRVFQVYVQADSPCSSSCATAASISPSCRR